MKANRMQKPMAKLARKDGFFEMHDPGGEMRAHAGAHVIASAASSRR